VPQPLDPADLDPEQGELWQSARVAQFMDGATDFALVAYRTFLDTNPPARFAAATAMSIAVLLDAAVELCERSETHATAVLQWRQLWTLHDRARQFHHQIRPQLGSLLDEEPVGAKVIRTRHTAKGRGDAGAGRGEPFNCQILRSDPNGCRSMASRNEEVRLAQQFIPHPELGELELSVYLDDQPSCSPGNAPAPCGLDR
jgi:hypothetical protein